MKSALFIEKHNITTEQLQAIAADYIADGNRRRWEPYVAHASTGEPVLTGPFSVYAELYVTKILRMQKKLMKLKSLILLTDDSVSSTVMNNTAMTQWTEFIKEFPEEL